MDKKKKKGFTKKLTQEFWNDKQQNRVLTDIENNGLDATLKKFESYLAYSENLIKQHKETISFIKNQREWNPKSRK